MVVGCIVVVVVAVVVVVRYQKKLFFAYDITVVLDETQTSFSFHQLFAAATASSICYLLGPFRLSFSMLVTTSESEQAGSQSTTTTLLPVE